VNGWCIDASGRFLAIEQRKIGDPRNSNRSGFSRFSFCAICSRSAPSSLEVVRRTRGHQQQILGGRADEMSAGRSTR
jgi:hypothetical protein